MTPAERLAQAEAALNAFTRRHFPARTEGLDHGMLNLPLHKRGDIDAEAREYARLQARVDHWRHKVTREQGRAQAPALRAAKERAHDAADLKARYGGCTEVLWSLSGRWLPVIRWNRKTVTVDMGGARESIPHTQVGGGR